MDENQSNEGCQQTVAERLKVLLVEDDASTREALRRFIVRCGHKAAAASNPASAKTLASELRPDVVICDWQLGDALLDGIDVARELSLRYRSRIVMITGQSLPELKRRAGNLNVSHYIRKPLSLANIKTALSTTED